MKKFILTFLLLCGSVYGQSPSGIIDPVRYIDWSTSGVVGGIPTVTTACANLTTSNTLAQIRTALTSCPSGQVVNFAAGTYNLAGAIRIQSDGVVMRGAGPSTILNFTSDTDSDWPWAGKGLLQVFSSSNPYTSDTAPGVAGIAASTIKTFTGTNGSADTFTKGATVLNMNSTSGFAAGDMLVCWQLNDADANVPTANFFISSSTTNPNNAVVWQGSHDSFGAGLEHRSMITTINSSTSLTVADGIPFPTGTWKTSRTPQCGVLNDTKVLSNVGIENMTIQSINSSTNDICLVCVEGTTNFWMKGVVLKPKFGAIGCYCGTDYGLQLQDSTHATIIHNWFDKMAGGGFYTTTSYAAVFPMSTFFRLENNIFNNSESPLEILVGTVGGAYLYNFENPLSGAEAGMQAHDLNYAYNLVEGNSFLKYFADALHGGGGFHTMFRNHIQSGGVDLWSYHRNYNIIGNAINCNTIYETQSADTTTYDRFLGACYRLGYNQQYGTAQGYVSGATACAAGTGGYVPSTSSCVALDTQVKISSMRWGNYTPVPGGVRFESSEVPSSGTQFTNAVPGSQTLPASFIYTTSPSYWSTGAAWPLIGPDVSGGTYVSGYAKKTPAQLCFEAAGGTYGSYSSGTSANFAPTTCYDGGGAGQGGACVTPSKLLYISQPGGTVIGAALAPVSIGVYDSANVLCTSATNTITIAKTGGTCTGMDLTGTTSGDAVTGVFTTSNLTLSTATGSCTFTASASGLTSAVSNAFTISAAGGSSGGIGARLKLRIR